VPDARQDVAGLQGRRDEIGDADFEETEHLLRLARFGDGHQRRVE
jgi:hypothetical protein